MRNVGLHSLCAPLLDPSLTVKLPSPPYVAETFHVPLGCGSALVAEGTTNQPAFKTHVAVACSPETTIGWRSLPSHVRSREPVWGIVDTAKRTGPDSTEVPLPAWMVAVKVVDPPLVGLESNVIVMWVVPTTTVSDRGTAVLVEKLASPEYFAVTV